MEQGLEFILLICLRFVVGAPRLRVGSPLFGERDSLGHGHTAIGVLFALHHKSSRENVLALYPACFMVGASAACNLRHEMYPVRPTASLRRNNPNTALLLNCSGCRQFHSALLSQVHSALVYLRNILLSRYTSVKHKMYLDNILLSGICFCSWRWSRSDKKGIVAIGASTNGCRATALKASREYARSAKALTGTSRASIKSRRDNALSKVWRRGRESNPLPCTSTVPWFLRPPYCRSSTSPLKAASRENRVQTFASYSHCCIAFVLLPSFKALTSACAKRLTRLFPFFFVWYKLVDLTSADANFHNLRVSFDDRVNIGQEIFVTANRDTVANKFIADFARGQSFRVLTKNDPDSFCFSYLGRDKRQLDAFSFRKHYKRVTHLLVCGNLLANALLLTLQFEYFLPYLRELIFVRHYIWRVI